MVLPRCREPGLLAVARDHPLAACESVSFEDLADHRVGDLDITLPPPAEPTGRSDASIAMHGWDAEPA